MKMLMLKSTGKFLARIPLVLPLVLLLAWMSSSGCFAPKVVVVSADQAETLVASNQTFTATSEGVFMPMGRYLRYQRAVADRIQESSVDGRTER